MSKRNPGTLGVWGPMGTRVVAAESYWRLPEKWNRDASFVVDLGEPRPRVFCASLADVFEDWQGAMTAVNGRQLWQAGDGWTDKPGGRTLDMDHVRARLFRLIDATPNLDWLLLTKRPENIVRMMPERSPRRQCPAGVSDVYRPNVWLGTSVENQATKTRIDILRTIPAAIRFLSVEPLLEDLGQLNLDGIHWVIVGGESGPNARPMHPNWVRSIRDQCQAAGVPFHFKQWGAFEPVTPLYRGRDDTLETGGEVVVNSDGTIHNDRDGQPNDPHAWLMHRVGKKSAGRLLDGRTWDEVPEVSRG
jgi:protein gp37